MSALTGVWARTRAFLVKETIVALGQPRLLLSLIVGPFLLLLCFGLGFQGRSTVYSVALVVPDRPAMPVSTGLYRQFFLWSLHLATVTTDEAGALVALERGEVDVVVVAPPTPLADLARDEPARFQVFIDTLDPIDRARINALVYGHTRELNAVLVAAMLEGILQATGLQAPQTTALTELRHRLLTGDSDGALGVIDRLLAAVVILRLTGEGVYQVATAPGEQTPTDPPLARFELLLRAVRAEVAAEPGLTAAQEAQLGELEQKAVLLPDVVRVAARISPNGWRHRSIIG